MKTKKKKPTMKTKKIPARNHLKCPCCGEIGDYSIDNQENVYCIHCGLIIEAPYCFTGGFKFDLICDIIHKQKVRELIKWKKDF